MAEDHVDFSLLTNNFNTRTFKAGETIFSAGDTGKEMYIVKSGSVEIRHNGRTLETVGPQGVFGEMAIIDGAARSASAAAAADSEVVTLNERQFVYLVGETPYFAVNVMRVMAARLRATTAAT